MLWSRSPVYGQKAQSEPPDSDVAVPHPEEPTRNAVATEIHESDYF